VSECLGDDCTHPDCTHIREQQPPTIQLSKSDQARLATGYSPEKWAALTRAERRAAMRAVKRK
jgi:hypothetical protein